MKKKETKLLLGVGAILLTGMTVGACGTFASDKNVPTAKQETEVLQEEKINISEVDDMESMGKTKDEIYAEYTENVFVNQILTTETGLAEDNLTLDYADNDTIIFHQKYGIFIYSISENKLLGAASWEEFGYPYEMSDTTNIISVNKQGTKIYIQSTETPDISVFDVKSKEIETTESPLPDTEKYNNQNHTSTCLNLDSTVARTDECIPLTDSTYLYLESGSGILQDLCYVIENTTEGTRQTGYIFTDIPTE